MFTTVWNKTHHVGYHCKILIKKTNKYKAFHLWITQDTSLCTQAMCQPHGDATLFFEPAFHFEHLYLSLYIAVCLHLTRCAARQCGIKSESVEKVVTRRRDDHPTHSVPLAFNKENSQEETSVTYHFAVGLSMLCRLLWWEVSHIFTQTCLELATKYSKVRLYLILSGSMKYYTSKCYIWYINSNDRPWK